LVCSVLYLGGVTMPRFSVGHGDGTGAAGGEVPTLEGEFLPSNGTTRVRILPITRPARNDLRETRPVREARQFKPTVEAKKIARRDPPAEVIPSRSAPPPPKPPKAAVHLPDASPAVPHPLPPRRAVAEVNVGELMKTSTGPDLPDHAADGSASSSSAGGPGGGGGGGGGSGGAPTPLVTNVLPAYPPEALARGIEGTVMLRVLVGQDGTVRRTTVETSSGDATLDESALATVRDHWRFEPARRAGMAIELEVRVPIHFRLRQ
jgi:protein TonB